MGCVSEVTASVSASCLRSALRWSFSARFSWRARSFWRLANVVRELGAIFLRLRSAPKDSGMCVESTGFNNKEAAKMQEVASLGSVF